MTTAEKLQLAGVLVTLAAAFFAWRAAAAAKSALELEREAREHRERDRRLQELNRVMDAIIALRNNAYKIRSNSIPPKNEADLWNRQLKESKYVLKGALSACTEDLLDCKRCLRVDSVNELADGASIQNALEEVENFRLDLLNPRKESD